MASKRNVVLLGRPDLQKNIGSFLKQKRLWLPAAVLAGALAVGYGVKHYYDNYVYRDNPEYTFKGLIADNDVEFYERNHGRKNTLRVRTTGGNVVEYVDTDNDLKLNYIKTIVGDNVTLYDIASINPETKKVMADGQNVFDEYLTEITLIQTEPIKSINSEDY